MDGQRIQFAILDEVVSFHDNENVDTSHHQTPNCPQCGRFCKCSAADYRYDGQGTQCYVTYFCSFCGTFEEALW